LWVGTLQFDAAQVHALCQRLSRLEVHKAETAIDIVLIVIGHRRDKADLGLRLRRHLRCVLNLCVLRCGRSGRRGQQYGQGSHPYATSHPPRSPALFGQHELLGLLLQHLLLRVSVTFQRYNVRRTYAFPVAPESANFCYRWPETSSLVLRAAFFCHSSDNCGRLIFSLKRRM
jgi:hypothetical protein